MADVLIIEDEASLLEVMETFLRRKGHSVTAVSNLDLARERSTGHSFDLALIDMNLGEGSSGVDFALELHENSPTTAIILTSGLFSDFAEITPQMRKAGVVRLLPKSVNLSEISATIRSVLDEQAHSR